MANHEFRVLRDKPCLHLAMDFPTYTLARRWIDSQPADARADLFLVTRGSGQTLWRADWTLVDNARAIASVATHRYGYPLSDDDEAMLANPADGSDAEGNYVDANYTLSAILRESEEWLRLTCLYCSEDIYPTARGFRTVGDDSDTDAIDDAYVCVDAGAGRHGAVCATCAGTGTRIAVDPDHDYWQGTE